jgi:arginine/lysine/ornithine decarboxylase
MKNFIILDRLMEQAQKNRVSFHVPGHKNGRVFKKYKDKHFMKDIFSLDITEIPGMDNLHAPVGMIKEAQEKAAAFFNADHTFFLINGTSTGIISALMAVANPKDEVIIPRDCHRSVIHGLILGDLIPVYILPEMNARMNRMMGIKPETIEKTIQNHPNVKAIVITYPNYYGICSDIEEIVKVAHRYDKILIVDEAHGAHLSLSEKLPVDALTAGADIVIQSTHKTLPALTQSSMLHVKSSRIDMDRLSLMLQINQSSSPSYLLMMGLDAARAIVEYEGRYLMHHLLHYISDLHDKILQMEGIKIWDKHMIGHYGVKNQDSTKLVIDMSSVGISGIALEEQLRMHYNIQMEMAMEDCVVGVSTIGNNREDFERLFHALQDIYKGRARSYKEVETVPFPHRIPIMKIEPRKAAYCHNKIEIDFIHSAGKISGEYVIPYPPGIPALCPGEEITEDMIRYIDQLKRKGIPIIGMADKRLEKIQIIQSAIVERGGK